MSMASYFEDIIQDARGEPEIEQSYFTAEEWLEKVRPYLDECEKSLSKEKLLDRVRETLISLSRQRRARPKKDDSRDVMMWQVFVRGGSTKQGEKRATTIEFTHDEREKASEFAKNPDLEIYGDERDKRIGKLCEVAFSKFLRIKGKNSPSSEDMFTKWMDFQTSDGKTINIRTSGQSFHKYVLVPLEPYEQQPKHYYVGISIFDNERKAEVRGFAAHQELKCFDHVVRETYGIKFDSLHPIIELIDMMDNTL